MSFAGCASSGDSVDNSQVEQTDEIIETSEVNNDVDAKQESNTEDEKTNIKELEEQYRPLLESGLIYENLVESEIPAYNGIMKNWDSLSNEFKSKYKDAKSRLEKSEATFRKKQKAIADAASYSTGITYNQLVRTPDAFKDKKVTFDGVVIQVIESDDETDLLIAVAGNSNEIVMVGFEPTLLGVRVLEDDYVTFRGISAGLYTYQTPLGLNSTVPLISVDYIRIN